MLSHVAVEKCGGVTVWCDTAELLEGRTKGAVVFGGNTSVVVVVWCMWQSYLKDGPEMELSSMVVLLW